MPKYLISYRKIEETGQKPEWAAFTCESELSLEAHAVKERVEKRMSVLGERLWGNGEAVWLGTGRPDDILFQRGGVTPETALLYEGFEVVLVNSNPATIMTDPEMADRTYVEPLTPEFVAKVIERERPDAMLPTVGGQTGLNLAVALAEDGTLDRYGVELIGAKLPAIKTGEGRNLFGAAMERIGLGIPKGFYAKSPDDALAGMRHRRMQFPLIIRPS